MLSKLLGLVSAVVLAGLLCLAQPPVTTAAAAPAPQCWAVVIGIAQYQHLTGLNYANDDASELAKILRPAWGDDHTQLLLDGDATRSRILAAIDWLSLKDSPVDTDLIYFSGHSSQSDAAIAPYEASVADTFLSSQVLHDRLSRLDSRKVIVVLDACNASQFQ
jgi:hypothetical protein